MAPASLPARLEGPGFPYNPTLCDSDSLFSRASFSLRQATSHARSSRRPSRKTRKSGSPSRKLSRPVRTAMRRLTPSCSSAAGIGRVGERQGSIASFVDRRRWRDDREQEIWQHRDEAAVPQLSAASRMARARGYRREGRGARQQRPVPGVHGARRCRVQLDILYWSNDKTYVNGQAASIYKQAIPLANAMRKPGDWQVYDVIWTAPTFHANGTVKRRHRDRLPQRRAGAESLRSEGRNVLHRKPSYKAFDGAPIKLQSHGDPSKPISFRNIWIREL